MYTNYPDKRVILPDIIAWPVDVYHARLDTDVMAVENKVAEEGSIR